MTTTATMYRAIQVANHLVGLSLASDRHLTNMALQKILYFAEGRYLAAHGRRLFSDRIEAWDYGPVVPSVYREFKRYGSRPITERAKRLDMPGGWQTWQWEVPDLPITPSTERDRQFLADMWGDYGTRTAVALMKETHKPGGPWSQVYSVADRHVEIPPEALRAYFSQNVA